MNNETVSIAIPVYNSETFLEQSINSALNQTYSELEIIAIDDGSNDNSLQILKNYEDKIKIIHQSNQGLAYALNNAIKTMNGKWFKWFSPDDVLLPQSVEVLVNEAKKNPENTIVYSNWMMIDENNNELRSFKESNLNELEIFDYNVRLLDGQQINVNTSLIPSILFKKGCLFRQLSEPTAIDYDFFLRAGILHHTKFHLIEKTLLKYRIHSEQFSHSNISQTLNFLSGLRTEILSSISENERKKYDVALKNFNKKKSIPKKTMDLGLKITKNLPTSVSDKLLVFYLNNIRRSRL